MIFYINVIKNLLQIKILNIKRTKIYTIQNIINLIKNCYRLFLTLTE